MGYGLMSSALGWPWPDDGLGEGGPEQKFQGGPSPYFFFLGPGGAWAPLALYLGLSLPISQKRLKKPVLIFCYYY